MFSGFPVHNCWPLGKRVRQEKTILSSVSAKKENKKFTCADSDSPEDAVVATLGSAVATPLPGPAVPEVVAAKTMEGVAPSPELSMILIGQ